MIDPIVQLSGLVVATVAANWLAGRLRIPSILPLLALGLLVGPGLRLIDPDGLFGDLLTPGVALAVGVILFEGGLSLRFREVEGRQRVIWLLVSVGVIITWAVGAGAAFFFIDLPLGLSLLLGSILVVSGPTVVGPMLQSVRPTRGVSSVLKWESIFIDPIGAMVAVLTFDAILAGASGVEPSAVAWEVIRFLGIGAGVAVVVAIPTIAVLRRHVLAERLLPWFGIAAAMVAYTVADEFVPEAGLLATTGLGLALANHHRARTEQIIRFAEEIRVMLIGVLFILLSARLTRQQISELGFGSVGLIAALMLIARPLGVAIATAKSKLDRNERWFLAGLAPRGIVAAAIASIFAIELEEAGIGGAESLAPLTFSVIIATVVVYGLGAGPLARRLGLAARHQEGILILGAGPVERAVADAFDRAGITVVLATTNRADEREARMAGHATFYGNVLDENVDLSLDLAGVGRLLAMTPNDEVNTLATLRFAELFGAAESYQMAARSDAPGVAGGAADMGGRPLFSTDLHYRSLARLLEQEGQLRSTSLSEVFGPDEFLAEHGLSAEVLFTVREGKVRVATVGDASLLETAPPGTELIWLNREPVDDPANGSIHSAG